MAVVRWSRERATGAVDPLAVDALDGHVLVLEGVTSEDDAALGWVRRAPCVVVGTAPAGRSPAAAADLALDEGEADVLAGVGAVVDAHPHAARVLVDVLRTVAELDVDGGLTVESLAYSTLLAGPEFGTWSSRQERRPRRDIAGEPVRLERRGEELRLTLARPENRNAFSAAMRDALFEALTVAVVDGSIRQVRLDGEGPVFSSGGDLTEFGTTPDVASAHAIRTRRSVAALLHRLRDVVTVHVQGSCVGAGVELPAFAGRVIAAPDTTFRLPELAMGLIPGAGGTVSLTRRIGRQAAARLAILGEQIDAPTAQALGLVDEVGGPG